MRRKGWILALLLALLLALSACGGVDVGIISSADGPTEIITAARPEPAPPEESPEEEPPAEPVPAEPEEMEPAEAVPAPVEEDGTYNSAEDVGMYLYLYGHLPENYITKSEARDLGWTGGSVEKYAPGCAIGGDRFGNREGVLPEGSYHECDIDTIGESSRGAKRLVYEDGGEIYYTEDHYESFTQLLFCEEADGSLTVSYGEE